MPSDYTIRGQAGQALAGNFRLGRDLKAVNASLTFENLGPDILQWTCRTKDLNAADTVIPSVGQQIELWDEANATRFFRGNVTQARVTNYGVQVIVEGPWQWLRKIDVTTSQTLNGSTQDRPTVVFNEGSVSSHITALLTRAIAAGAQVGIGSIATTFTVPKLQLSMMTFADVLAELMRWVPDCIGWWDYSGSGTPTFNLSRRGTLPATTYALGTAPLESFDMTGRQDLQPSRVEVKFTARATDQRPQFNEQVAGTAVAGRVQVIGLSGKELDTFLPADEYGSAVVQTTAANVTAGTLEPSILNLLPEVQTSRAAYPGLPGTSDVILANGESLTTNSAIGGGGGTTYNTVMPTIQWINPETGAPVSVVGKNLLLTTNPPDWLNLANSERVKLTGRIYAISPSIIYKSPYGPGDSADPAALPAWASAFGWSATIPLPGYTAATSFAQPFPYDRYRVNVLALDFELDVILTTSSYPTATTLYRQQDYEYLAPPANLATNLLAAQAFVPYEGNIRLKYGNLPPITNGLASKYRLTGSVAELATADALARAVTYDLAAQSVDIDLGAPARFSFGTLGGKVRQSPQTNITIN